jgi:streptogramin lyase
VLPRASTKQAALFYRLPQTGAPGSPPLKGSLKLVQRRSPRSRIQPTLNPAAPAMQVKTFGAGEGAGEPWGTATDSAGNVWFAEPGCDFAPTCPANTAPGQIGELEVASHTFSFYRLPKITGNQPIFLAFDVSGNLWFTTPNNSMIGEFDPARSRFVGQWPVSAGSGPWDLTFAAGRVWYTEHFVSAVGSFDPSTHAHQDFQTPTSNTNPYGITANGGLIWFTENNSSVDRIAVLNTAILNAGSSTAIAEYPIVLPLSGTPHLITVDAHGNPWWTEGWSNTIATLNLSAATPGVCGTASGTCNGIQRFNPPAPTSCSASGTHTSGIAFQASSGLVWFDNSLTAQIGSFNPSNDAFAVTGLSDCGAHPHDGLNLDDEGHVWFDAEFENALGEVIPPGSAVRCDRGVLGGAARPAPEARRGRRGASSRRSGERKGSPRPPEAVACSSLSGRAS